MCNLCKHDFPQKEIEVDHIVEIGREKTWDEFIDGLFCEKDNLQAVCKPCHREKTLKERSANAEQKKALPKGRKHDHCTMGRSSGY